MNAGTDRRQQGFSLLELLVVVAILATLGGLLIVAYDGLESQASKKVATNTIASLDNAVRMYTVNQRRAPNDLDSLVAADPADPASNFEALSILGASLRGKITPAPLTREMLDSLNGAGILSLRYVDIAGNVDAAATLDVPAADGAAADVGPISAIDIPNRVFDVPRPGSGRNRGRGFSSTLTVGSPVMLWIPGPGGIDVSKVGGSAAGSEDGGTGDGNDDDVLIAFGLGNNSTIVQDDASTRGDVTLGSAPFYTDVLPNEYGRYVLLYNVGSVNAPRDRAKLQAVVDARGDFLDEEYAEGTGQKQ